MDYDYEYDETGVDLPLTVLFSGDRYSKHYKEYLANQGLIHCSYCSFNRGENRKWYRKRGTQQKKRIAWKEARNKDRKVGLTGREAGC